MSEEQEEVLGIAEPARAPALPILRVDLGRPVGRGDMPHRALFTFLARPPQRLPPVLRLLTLGQAELHRRLADGLIIDSGELPVSESVIELIRNGREEGRRVVLVSAAEQRQVNAVARLLGLFDEAFGTGTLPQTNLSGHDKA